MLALQASIGAFNDLADQAADAGEKPGKPLPAGVITRRAAWVVGVLAAAVGLVLSAPSGIPTLLVALAGAGLGWAYDAGLSRTVLSWLPLSLALPLLPIHAWLGATGSVPPGLLTLLPAAVLAGAALAIANGLVDAERDARAGRPAVVVAIGAGGAWAVHALLLLVVIALAVLVAPVVIVPAELPPGGEPSAGGLDRVRLLAVVQSLGVVLGLAALGVGAVLLRARRAWLRERGWEAEALGVACIGVGWLAGTAAAAAGT